MFNSWAIASFNHVAGVARPVSIFEIKDSVQLTRRDSAMRMTFLTSIVYLPLLFVAMVLTRR